MRLTSLLCAVVLVASVAHATTTSTTTSTSTTTTLAADLADNPITIDAASATTTYGPFRVKMIRWSGCTTAGHLAAIVSNTVPTHPIWRASCACNGDTIETNLDGAQFRTVLVPTLQSGRIEIWLDWR